MTDIVSLCSARCCHGQSPLCPSQQARCDLLGATLTITSSAQQIRKESHLYKQKARGAGLLFLNVVFAIPSPRAVTTPVRHRVCLLWVCWSSAPRLHLLLLEAAQVKRQSLRHRFCFRNIIAWATQRTRCTSITAAPWLDACLLLHSESWQRAGSLRRCLLLSGWRTYRLVVQCVELLAHVPCLWNVGNELERNSLLGCFGLGKMHCWT